MPHCLQIGICDNGSEHEVNTSVLAWSHKNGMHFQKGVYLLKRNDLGLTICLFLECTRSS